MQHMVKLLLTPSSLFAATREEIKGEAAWTGVSPLRSWGTWPQSRISALAQVFFCNAPRYRDVRKVFATYFQLFILIN